MKKALIVIMALPMMACDQGERVGVGPWDTNDHPGYTSDGPAHFAEPDRMVAARGDTADFSGKIRVRLVAISRFQQGPKEAEYSVQDRSWTPSGAPFLGKSLPGGGYPDRFSEREDKGARYLEFEITAPTTDWVEVYGYIPGRLSAHPAKPEEHGRDVLTAVQLNSHFPVRYRTPIVVEDGKADRYRFGLAQGEWVQVAATSAIPADSDSRDLIKGNWGVLRMVGPPKLRPGQVEISERPPVVAFEVVPSEPVNQSFRVRLFDKDGRDLLQGSISHQPQRVTFSPMGLKNLSRIEVEARPMSYVEFKDVHFDPDPKLWERAYWGSEGTKTITRMDGIATLEGLLRPKVEGQFWTNAEFFSTDGTRWREYTPPDRLQSRFSTGDWPKEPLVGILRLDRNLVAQGQNVRIDAFGANSSRPGVGIEPKPLQRWTIAYDQEIAQPLFERPDTPFVQFALRVSDQAWTREGSAAPPDVSWVEYSPEDRAAMARGVNVGRRALTVILRPNGSLDFFYPKPDNPNVIEKANVQWAPDREKRLVALMKNGERRRLWNNGASSAGDVEFHFELDKEGLPTLNAVRSKVRLTDIQAFEVETRGYAEPVYLVAKVPAPSKH